MVTPFTGVWIEIYVSNWCGTLKYIVTPFTGVWIEILLQYHPIWNRAVTPFTGVWIEIRLS